MNKPGQESGDSRSAYARRNDGDVDLRATPGHATGDCSDYSRPGAAEGSDAEPHGRRSGIAGSDEHVRGCLAPRHPLNAVAPRGTPQTAQRSLRDPDADAADTATQTLDGTLPYTETWHTNATNVVGLAGRVGRLEEALRATESIAAEHEGVTPEAYELISDVTRDALVGVETGQPQAETGDASGVVAEDTGLSGGSA